MLTGDKSLNSYKGSFVQIKQTMLNQAHNFCRTTCLIWVYLSLQGIFADAFELPAVLCTMLFGTDVVRYSSQIQTSL